jgi:hypothetical protein
MSKTEKVGFKSTTSAPVARFGAINASRPNLLPCLGFFSQELQNFVCLFARKFSVALGPSRKRLRRNSYGLGDSRGVLDDDVPIVSESGELFFGRFHAQTIPEIGATRPNMIADLLLALFMMCASVGDCAKGDPYPPDRERGCLCQRRQSS